MVSTTRCIYTCPVRLECGPDHLLKCFEWSDLYYKMHEVTRCKQPLYIYFMLFYIEMKLSSRLCLTHKRVTQKYRNSILIKKKKNCARIGSDRNRRYSEFSGSDRIWKNGIVASLMKMSVFHWDLRLNKLLKYCRSCSINFHMQLHIVG